MNESFSATIRSQALFLFIYAAERASSFLIVKLMGRAEFKLHLLRKLGIAVNLTVRMRHGNSDHFAAVSKMKTYLISGSATMH